MRVLHKVAYKAKWKFIDAYRTVRCFVTKKHIWEYQDNGLPGIWNSEWMCCVLCTKVVDNQDEWDKMPSKHKRYFSV